MTEGDWTAEAGWQLDTSNFHWNGTEFLREEWLTVVHGGLSQPIQVKFEVLPDSRVQIVGIKLDNGERITARTMREPRLTKLEAQLTAALRAELDAIEEERVRAVNRLAQAGDPEEEQRARWDLESVEQFEADLDAALAKVRALRGPDAAPFRARGRGAAPPTEADYLAFADLYLEQVKQHRKLSTAVVATARAAGINRSTAYRWIEACRAPERQYLPPKDES